jgi:hypothetical protein
MLMEQSLDHLGHPRRLAGDERLAHIEKVIPGANDSHM